MERTYRDEGSKPLKILTKEDQRNTVHPRKYFIGVYYHVLHEIMFCVYTDRFCRTPVARPRTVPLLDLTALSGSPTCHVARMWCSEGGVVLNWALLSSRKLYKMSTKFFSYCREQGSHPTSVCEKTLHFV